MAEARTCLGHSEREKRLNKITKLSGSPMKPPVPDKSLRVLIKKGPVSEEISLDELENAFANTPEWKLVRDGGVLSVPVEELRMLNPPKPDHSGQLHFGKRKGGAGKQIDNYPTGQTIENLNAIILAKYNEKKEIALKSGESTSQAEKEAATEAVKAPEYTATKSWQDIEAEITLKRAVEEVMAKLKVPCVIIRSTNLKDVSVLKDLGLGLLGDAEIDLILAHAAGDFLHVTIFEVKRKDTYPWQTETPIPNKQMVNSAEKQLLKDLDVLTALLAGVPPNKIVFNTLACFPDTPYSLLQNICCTECLSKTIICQEDIRDFKRLEEKILGAEKPEPATECGSRFLLMLSTRLLSRHSVLHVGYREIKDKESVATLRQRFNLKSVDDKMVQSQFIVASPQQQDAIARFTSSSAERHLILSGAAGTGKTLVAIQVANKLLESAISQAEPGRGPILVVTTEAQDNDEPISKYLDERAGTAAGVTKMHRGKVEGLRREFNIEVKTYELDDQEKEFGISQQRMEFVRRENKKLKSQSYKLLFDAMVQKWEGRQIVFLVDEIYDKDLIEDLLENVPEENMRLVLVMNPKSDEKKSLMLDFSHRPYLSSQPISPYLQITLTTTYRSTRAITRLARFMAKCYRKNWRCDADSGSDVEGQKPIVIVLENFNEAINNNKLVEALAEGRRLIGRSGTLLYRDYLVNINKTVKSMIDNAGIESIYSAFQFHGWEADRVLAITQGGDDDTVMEVITRARTHLCVILLGGTKVSKKKSKEKQSFEKAAAEGLIELFPTDNKDITQIDWGTID